MQVSPLQRLHWQRLLNHRSDVTGFSGGQSAALFMDKIPVGNAMQETKTRLLPMPNRAETRVERADGRAIISSTNAKSREPPAVNPHLPSDADMQLFQQGTHCRLQEKL